LEIAVLFGVFDGFVRKASLPCGPLLNAVGCPSCFVMLVSPVRFVAALRPTQAIPATKNMLIV
jgi:hypothetical protein